MAVCLAGKHALFKFVVAWGWREEPHLGVLTLSRMRGATGGGLVAACADQLVPSPEAWTGLFSQRRSVVATTSWQSLVGPQKIKIKEMNRHEVKIDVGLLRSVWIYVFAGIFLVLVWYVLELILCVVFECVLGKVLPLLSCFRAKPMLIPKFFPLQYTACLKVFFCTSAAPSRFFSSSQVTTYAWPNKECRGLIRCRFLIRTAVLAYS